MRADPGIWRSDAHQNLAISDGEPIVPIPTSKNARPALVALGSELFKSTVVSDDGRVACADCHYYNHGLAMDTPNAALPNRPRTPTNATSLFNLRYQYKIGWIGKFDNIFDHNDALLTNTKIIGSSWERIALRLRADAAWNAKFGRAFADGATADNVRTALIEYEYSLTTPDAPFDRWLRGDKTAIVPDAERGFALFKDHGCISCHQGVAVGGNMLARFGVMDDFFAGRAKISDADLGRYALTHRDEDRYVFRVPSLRNVALTAPYFHDGSAASLEEAVAIMGRYQLGELLSREEIRCVVAFLETLTGVFKGGAS